MDFRTGSWASSGRVQELVIVSAQVNALGVWLLMTLMGILMDNHVLYDIELPRRG